MASKCKICKKFISPVDSIKCVKCKGLFHPVCLKYSPGHQVATKWKCHTCKTDDRLPSQSPSNLCGQEMNKDASQAVETSPGGLAEEVRQVIRAEMLYFRNELARICSTLADFSQRADAFETRLTALEERVSTVQPETILTALEDRVAVLSVQEKEKTHDIIINLQNQLNAQEQDYLLNDVEISGLQEKNNENVSHIISLIGRKLGVELSERDVVSAERSGPRRAFSEGEPPPRPRALTVRLARRALRDELLRAARVRRGADSAGIIEGAARRFYINERLTRANRQLFYKAREEGRSKGWRYVWTSSGRIYIRKNANAKAYRVRSEVDLEKFFYDIVG